MSMRIVFFGTSDFSVRMLDSLIESGYEIAAVVTLPDRPSARGHRLIPTPVKEFAAGLNLNLIEVTDLKDEEFVRELRELKADLGVVVSFKILPRAVFTAPRLGTLNLHPSLLPKLRGAAPLRWALIRGLSETGVTTFLLDDKVDTGDILLSEKIPIGPNENYAELFDAVGSVGARLLRRSIDGLLDGSLKPIPQDNRLATKAPKLTREICRIDWSRRAIDVHNLVRALSPSPGAWTTLRGESVKILKAKYIDVADRHPPGEILACDPEEGLIIACGEGNIEVLKIQTAGKRPLEARVFLRGNELSKGWVFV